MRDLELHLLEGLWVRAGVDLLDNIRGVLNRLIQAHTVIPATAAAAAPLCPGVVAPRVAFARLTNRVKRPQYHHHKFFSFTSPLSMPSLRSRAMVSIFQR